VTASPITSACEHSSAFLTPSSIVILTAPATRRLLRQSRGTSNDHQRRVGRNHVPSDRQLTTLRDVATRGFARANQSAI
jgi:hypothetical protein